MRMWWSRKDIPGWLPGWLAKSSMVLLTAIWAFWGAGELYHEGWWGAWYNPLFYLIPWVIFLSLTLVSLKWPFVGGGLILVFGIWAGFFFDAIPIGLAIVMIGGMFLLEGLRLKRLPASFPYRGRNWWIWAAVCPPILIFIGFSARMLPIVLTRQDDGDRSARVIAGNGLDLLWAPEGPGWNWRQPWGGYPSWDSIALYGAPPVGMDWKEKPGYGRQDDGTWRHASGGDMARSNLCFFLSDDGMTLMNEPQYFWRMPTVDELVRSLGRHGENAGCIWRGEFRRQVSCEIMPDKETPLWAPDLAPIYYWAAEAYDEQDGFFVSFNGYVNATRKSGGNPRHSYRCVREVDRYQ